MDQGHAAVPPRNSVRPRSRRGRHLPRPAVREGEVAANAAAGAERPGADAPLSLARHLTDLPIRVGSVPLALPMPNPQFEAYRSTLAALFTSEALPILRRHPRDNPLSYTVRALDEWKRMYRAPMELHLQGAPELIEEFSDYFDSVDTREQPDVAAGDLVVRVYGPESDTSSAAAMLEALRDHHPRLGGSLLTHIGKISAMTFGIFTPAEAWDLAEEHWFHYSERHFWEEHRHMAAGELKKPVADLTRRDLQAYIKQNEIMTPGAFKRALGLDVYQAICRPLSLEEIRAVITEDHFPEGQRRQVEAVLVLLADLDDLGRRLRGLQDDTSLMLTRMHQAKYARYATILDVTPWDCLESRYGTLQELLHDSENLRLQGDDQEGPNFTLHLTPEGDSAARFAEALGLLDTACQAVVHLTREIGHWEW